MTIPDRLEDRELVTIRQASQIVGVSRRTIHLWLAKHKVDSVRTAGGCVRIFRDSLFKTREPAVDE